MMRGGNPDERSKKYEQRRRRSTSHSKRTIFSFQLRHVRSMQLYWKLLSLPVGSQHARLMGVEVHFYQETLLTSHQVPCEGDGSGPSDRLGTATHTPRLQLDSQTVPKERPPFTKEVLSFLVCCWTLLLFPAFFSFCSKSNGGKPAEHEGVHGQQ